MHLSKASVLSTALQSIAFTTSTASLIAIPHPCHHYLTGTAISNLPATEAKEHVTLVVLEFLVMIYCPKLSTWYLCSLLLLIICTYV